MARVTDLLNLSNEQFLKLGKTELRKVVQQLATAGNKRLKRLEAEGYSTPASRYVTRSGGAFTTKGKNLNALREEYSRVRRFMESKTSSKTGYVEVRNKTLETIKKNNPDIDLRGSAIKDVEKKLKAEGKTVKDIGKREYNRMLEKALQNRVSEMFSAYEKIKESDPSVANRSFKYSTLKQVSQRMEKHPNESSETVAEKVKKTLSKLYEAETELNNESNGVSQFFEL